jgi:hypothetical protein
MEFHSFQKKRGIAPLLLIASNKAVDYLLPSVAHDPLPLQEFLPSAPCPLQEFLPLHACFSLPSAVLQLAFSILALSLPLQLDLPSSPANAGAALTKEAVKSPKSAADASLLVDFI